MNNSRKKPLVLRRANYARILWERRICMAAALVCAALAYLESWVGLVALAGTFLFVLALLTMWALSDWAEWSWPTVVIWLFALILLLNLRTEVWASAIRLRDLAVLLSPMVIFGVLIAAGAVHRRRLKQVDAGSIVILLVVMGLFTVTWMNCANQRYDRKTPESRAGQVVGWHRTTPYKGATRHYADVTYPDATGRPTMVSLPVPRDQYETLEVGESVTLTLHDGAFGIPWLTGTFEEN